MDFYFQLCGNAILKLFVRNWRPKVNSIILTYSMRNLSVTSSLIFLFSLRNFIIYLISSLSTVNMYGNSLILPEDGVILRNVVNNKVVFLSLCSRC